MGVSLVVGNYSSAENKFCETSWNTGFKLPLEIYLSGSLSWPNPGRRSAHINPFREGGSQQTSHDSIWPYKNALSLWQRLDIDPWTCKTSVILNDRIGTWHPQALFSICSPTLNPVCSEEFKWMFCSIYFQIFELAWGKQDLFISTVAISQWK